MVQWCSTTAGSHPSYCGLCTRGRGNSGRSRGRGFRTLGRTESRTQARRRAPEPAPIKRRDGDGRPSSAIIAPQEGHTVYSVYSPGPGLVVVSEFWDRECGGGRAGSSRRDRKEDGRPSSAIIAPQEGHTVYTVYSVYSPGARTGCCLRIPGRSCRSGRPLAARQKKPPVLRSAKFAKICNEDDRRKKKISGAERSRACGPQAAREGIRGNPREREFVA